MKKEVNIGGQAVIEGVMMRSERYISIAVRRADGKIALKREEIRSWAKKFKFFKLPILRGSLILIESLIHGIGALSWSADVAIEEDKDDTKSRDQNNNSWKSKLSTAFTMIFGLGMGLFLFFWLPLVFTGWVGTETGFTFNLVDGIFRLTMFGLYLGLISMWKEIKRIYQYHGAEHKSIFALENDCPLTVEGARPFTTLHPRCGTSFLLIVMVMSIFVFMFLGKPETYADRFFRLLFVPVIGGISYEFIRLSGKYRDNKIARFFIYPGLMLQKVTTREPNDEQLEVGVTALRSALGEILDSDNIVHYESNGKLESEETHEDAAKDVSILESSGK